MIGAQLIGPGNVFTPMKHIALVTPMFLMMSLANAQVLLERTLLPYEPLHNLPLSNGDILLNSDGEQMEAPYHLYRLDPQGQQVLWSREFGNISNLSAMTPAVELPSGNLLFGANHTDSTGLHFSMVTVTAQGNFVGATSYSGPSSLSIPNLLLTSTGDIVVGHSAGAAQPMRIMKLDTIGNVLWALTCGTTTDDLRLSSLTQDDGMLLVGANGLLVRLDTDGAVLWAKRHPSTNSIFNIAREAVHLSSDRILLFLDVTTNGDRDLGVLSLDASGNMLHSTRFSGTGITTWVQFVRACALSPTTAACYTDLYGASQAQILVIDTMCAVSWSAGPQGPLVLCGFKSRPMKGTGNTIWLAGGPSYTYNSSVLYHVDLDQTPLGCWSPVVYSSVYDVFTPVQINLTPTLQSVQVETWSLPLLPLMVQTGSGCSTVDVGAAPRPLQWRLSAIPQASSEEVALEWPSELTGPIHWRIIDAYGRTVGSGTGSGNGLRAPVRDLASGLYTAEVRSEGVRLSASFFLLD